MLHRALRTCSDGLAPMINLLPLQGVDIAPHQATTLNPGRSFLPGGLPPQAPFRAEAVDFAAQKGHGVWSTVNVCAICVS